MKWVDPSSIEYTNTSNVWFSTSWITPLVAAYNKNKSDYTTVYRPLIPAECPTHFVWCIWMPQVCGLKLENPARAQMSTRWSMFFIKRRSNGNLQATPLIRSDGSKEHWGQGWGSACFSRLFPSNRFESYSLWHTFRDRSPQAKKAHGVHVVRGYYHDHQEHDWTQFLRKLIRILINWQLFRLR